MKDSVSNTVHELRRKEGITQQELADSVGVTRQTVIAIEKGNYVPSVLLAMRISRFFKEPIEKIFIVKK